MGTVWGRRGEEGWSFGSDGCDGGDVGRLRDGGPKALLLYLVGTNSWVFTARLVIH